MPAVDEWGALLPGCRIAGYEIKRKLGQGGFGIAYEGYNADLKARAAIKEFFPRDLVGRSGASVSVREGESKGFYERFLNRFVDEARAVHHLDHPNIVKVRHFERTNNTAYVVMDYIEGGSLKSWLEAHAGKLSEADIKSAFAPILGALAYVHTQNLLHRDISPANIMIDKAGKPWLIDFGAFKEMWQEQPRRTSLLAANPAYAPPEQSDIGADQNHGPFTDIFALSATMYEAIAGHKPASAVSRMTQQFNGRSDPLAPLDAGATVVACRPEVKRAVMRGLSLRPEARPQTLTAFEAELGWSTAAPPSAGRLPSSATPMPHPGGATRVLPPTLVASSTTPPLAPAPAITPPEKLSPSARGVWISATVAVVTALLVLGLWNMRGPIFDQAAELEYAIIASSADISVHEAFAKKHAGTKAGQRAEQRAAELRRQRASVETERQRRAGFAAAAAEWARIKDTTDANVLERFIVAHGDAPVVGEARLRLADIKRQREGREREARNASAAAEWNRLKASEDEVAIEKFLATYGETPSASDARARLAEVRREKAARAEADRLKQAKFTLAANEWSRIKDSTDEVLIERFIVAYPDTPAAQEAATRLAELRRQKHIALLPKEAPAPRPIEPVPRPSDAADDEAFTKSEEQNVIAAWQAYLAAFPNGRHVAKAKARVEEREKSDLVVRVFKGHTMGIGPMALSPDGRYLLTASNDSDDTDSDTTLRLWETATGQLLRVFSGHRKGVQSVAFSPNGRKVASASRDQTVRLWEAGSGRHIHTLAGHSKDVSAIAFTPDGRFLISGSRDRTLKQWDTATGQLIRTFAGDHGSINALAISPDGRILVSGSHIGNITQWEIATGRVTRTLTGHGKWPVSSLAFTPDGRLLLSGGFDTWLRLWNLDSGSVIRSFRRAGASNGLGHAIRSLAISPDGRYFVADEGFILLWSTLWEIGSGREIHTFKRLTSKCEFMPNRRLIVGIDNKDRKIAALVDISGLLPVP